MKTRRTRRSADIQADRPLRLLVVEDHADTRRTMELFLKKLAWDVRFAANFDAGLAAGTQERFDVLLSDLNLPDGNGWELMERLEARDRRPQYAIAVSGYGTSRDIAKSKSAGFNAHLVKPINPEELIELLHTAQRKLLKSRLPRKKAGVNS